MHKNIIFPLFIALFFSACAAMNYDENSQNHELESVKNVKVLKSSREIAFEWDPIFNSSLKGYKIYRKTDGQSENARLIATLPNIYATHYSDDNLEPNTKYIYYICTFDENSISQAATVHEKTADTIAPITFVQGIAGLANKIKIIWRPHTDIRVVKYYIYKQSANSDKWRRIAVVDKRLSAEFIDDVKPNEYARYKVSAVSFDNLESLASKSVEALSKTLPPKVINLSASTNLAKKIALTWDAPEYNDFSYYKIYSANASWLPLKEIARTNKTNYIDDVGFDGVSRFYSVTMVDKDGLESERLASVNGMSLSKPSAPLISQSEYQSNDSVLIRWINQDARVVKFRLYKNDALIADGLTGNQFIDLHYQKNDFYNIVGVDEFGIESDYSKTYKVK